MKTTTSSFEAASSRTTASTTEEAVNATGPSINSLGFDGNPFYTYHPVQVFLTPIVAPDLGISTYDFRGF